MVTICKNCFEVLCPNPHFSTVDEYLEERGWKEEDRLSDSAREKHMRMPDGHARIIRMSLTKQYRHLTNLDGLPLILI